ncbi:MAG: hypothetical protein ACI4K7_05430 [Oscillospiraceae bacterium]
MKKNLLLLPVGLFPYGGLIFGLIYSSASVILPEAASEICSVILSVLMACFYISCPVCAVIWAVFAAKGRVSPYEAAKSVLIVKAVHIPAYVFNFAAAFLGVFVGALASVWGIGIAAVSIGLAFAADVCTIALTGICSAGELINIYKGGVIPKKYAVISGILSFIFCADVVTAVVLFVKCRK